MSEKARSDWRRIASIGTSGVHECHERTCTLAKPPLYVFKLLGPVTTPCVEWNTFSHPNTAAIVGTTHDRGAPTPWLRIVVQVAAASYSNSIAVRYH